MIVPMSQIAVLFQRTTTEAALARLQALGAVHIAHVTTPRGEDLETARQTQALVDDALTALGGREQAGAGDEAADLDALVTAVSRHKALQREQLQLRDRMAEAALFGNVEAATLTALTEDGVNVRFVEVAEDEAPALLPGIAAVELATDGRRRRLAVIAAGDIPDLPGRELTLSETSASALQARAAEVEAELTTCAEALDAHAGALSALQAAAGSRAAALSRLEVASGMGADGGIAYVTGFIPSTQAAEIKAAAAEAGWGVHIGEPTTAAAAPTLISNPAWVRPIRAVMDFIGVVPGYGEVDISRAFLIFFSLFVAMIVGDFGYGVLMVLGTLTAMKLVKKPLPSGLVPLLLLTGVCTIIWGLVTGNCFGLAKLPPLLAAARIDWLKQDNNVILTCFAIGAVHLTLAHFWNGLRQLNTPQCLAQFGWIATTWTMYFAACSAVLGAPFPGWVYYLFGVGVVLIILFTTPISELKAEWHNHAMLPLSLVSNFVDVVSYVRLFAVGMATFAVAEALNDIAAGIGFDGLVSGLLAALVLFFGHMLNIMLAAMGVLVHGIRLNTLEFSGHLGMRWDGVAYNPFALPDGDNDTSNLKTD
jgi:V/A-type H+-transporting ATPase subunit I